MTNTDAIVNKEETIGKRNGEVVAYNGSKIVNAILKANRDVDAKEAVDKESAWFIEQYIHGLVTGGKIAIVEEIQDEVITQLFLNGFYKVALAYAEYRYQRQWVRKANTTDEGILGLIANSNKDTMEENSNKDAYAASTQRDLIAGEVSKDLSRRVLLPEKISKAHEEGAIHFHDMDYFLQPIFNCCLINIKDIFENGTVMNGKLIEEPKSFRVACTVLSQIVAAVASSQYGGQSVDVRHLGKYLRVSYDKAYRKSVERNKKLGLDEETVDKIARAEAEASKKVELEAGIQTIQYQLNTLMTTNGQSPFVTLFLNIPEGDEYEEEIAEVVYEIIRQRKVGIKNENGILVTPAFPKLVYVLDEHNCLKGGKYDYVTKLAVECSAKRMYPDYISAKKMREMKEGEVFSPMGCRSFLSPWYDEDGNVKFEGRFNQGVVSLNLPQIGILAKGNEEKFWGILEDRLSLCFEALMCRHRALEGVKARVSPIHWMHGAIARLDADDVIDPLLHGGYSTISLGYIGLYEVTKLMTGESHTSEKGKEFALRLMKRLRMACDAWKAETNIGFALYGTPAESLCYRFARIDKERFGDIEDVTDKGYYTNSYHVDVREHISAFDKLEFESQFQEISSGGYISYVEVPNLEKNPQALETLVQYIYENIAYAEFNSKCDECATCGYSGEMVLEPVNEAGDLDWKCPNCGETSHNKLSVIRRTCGYLGENFWNVGKTKEINQRVLHI